MKLLMVIVGNSECYEHLMLIKTALALNNRLCMAYKMSCFL
jgi:hypothetical protein